MTTTTRALEALSPDNVSPDNVSNGFSHLLPPSFSARCQAWGEWTTEDDAAPDDDVYLDIADLQYEEPLFHQSPDPLMELGLDRRLR